MDRNFLSFLCVYLLYVYILVLFGMWDVRGLFIDKEAVVPGSDIGVEQEDELATRLPEE